MPETYPINPNGAAGDRIFSCEYMDAYIIKTLISTHSCGSIYKCMDSKGDTFVVKSYWLHQDPEFIHTHFVKNIPVLQDNLHRNVVRMVKGVYDENADTLFEVFEVPSFKLYCLRDFIHSSAFDASFIKPRLFDALSGVSHYHGNRRAHGCITTSSFIWDQTLMLTSFKDPESSYPSYQAPELLLAPGAPPTFASDIWSLGCVFAEVVTRGPVFGGGVELEQIYRALIGLDDPAGWPVTPEELPRVNVIQFPALLYNMVRGNGLNVQGLHLLQQMLHLHPADRISAEVALRHLFFNDLDNF